MPPSHDLLGAMDARVSSGMWMTVARDELGAKLAIPPVDLTASESDALVHLGLKLR